MADTEHTAPAPEPIVTVLQALVGKVEAQGLIVCAAAAALKDNPHFAAALQAGFDRQMQNFSAEGRAGPVQQQFVAELRRLLPADQLPQQLRA